MNISIDKIMDMIVWLQDWVAALFEKNYFNDSYEYDGIDIIGINNTWKVNIYVLYTYLENQRFNAISIDNNSDNWVSINVENGIYKAMGDNTKLVYIIDAFKQWNNEVLNDNCKLKKIDIVEDNSLTAWLQRWFAEVCELYLKKDNIIHISTLDNPGWTVKIDVKDTKFDNKKFSTINIDNGDDDWIFVNVENNKFVAYGDNKKLSYIIQVFKNWCAF